MSREIQFKIQDVIHEEGDFDSQQVESYIEEWISGIEVVNVRVASGDTNSPLFITVKATSLSIGSMKSIARDAVRAFSEFVDGVDVQEVVRDENILIKSE